MTGGRADSVLPLSAIGAAEGDPISLFWRTLALHDWDGTGGMKMKSAAFDTVDKLLFFQESDAESGITKLFFNVSNLGLISQKTSEDV
jgi:hypothetical protein